MKNRLFLLAALIFLVNPIFAADTAADSQGESNQEAPSGKHRLLSAFRLKSFRKFHSPLTTRREIVEAHVETEAQLPYNYFNEDFIKSVIADGSRYVLVGTGWSESSLGKMNVNNQEKQKRGFAISMAQILKVNQLGGEGKLIYLTTSPISPNYRRYLYRVANQNNIAGLSEREIEARYDKFEKQYLKIVYLTPKGRDKTETNRTKYLTVDRNALKQFQLERELILLRSDKYVSNKIVGMTAHFTGPFVESLAKEWKLPYLVNPSDQGHWIKKSMSRQSFRDAGVRHAKGTYEPAFSKEALVNDIYDLLAQIKGRKIILKLDQSAAGYGNRVLRLNDVTQDLSEEEAKTRIMAHLNDKENFSDVFVGRIEEDGGGAIIEEFLDCQNYASPASIFMINGLNDVEVQYTYDQLLGGKDNMVFQGSLGPVVIPDNEEGNIREMSRQVGLYLSTQGVRGNIGTDFVVCDAEDHSGKRIAYAIENNVRMTGTSYPYYTIRTFLGVETMKHKFLKSFDDVKIPTITRKKPREALNRDFFLTFLKNHPLNLNLTTGEGCLVHNDTFRLGKLGISCVGNSKEDVIGMYDQFASSINEYLEDHDITLQFNRFIMTKKREALVDDESIVED